MPPLSYEKAILRSFVPTWRETLIFYLKNGSLDKNKNYSLVDRLGTSSKVESELHNGLIILSSGVNLNRILFYLVFYISNPLHVYEYDTLLPDFKMNLSKEPILNEDLNPDYEKLLDDIDINSMCVDSCVKKEENTTLKQRRVKRNKFEISESVKKEFAVDPAETDQPFGDDDLDTKTNRFKVDDIYDCPSLIVKNSKLSIKSNKMYRKIFCMCDPIRRAKIWERQFLFNDVSIQSTVTMYTHLVFILGYELMDYVNYTNLYKYLKKKLFVKLGIDQSKISQNDVKEGSSVVYKDILEGSIKLPKLEIIDGSVLSHHRQQLYVNGGFYCIPSRILVNDILSGKVLPEIIGGILVMNAHQVLDDCNIPFIIKLLRLRNKVAFVKAISNNVFSFKGNNLNTSLKNLLTKNVYIYPRCHHYLESVLNDTEVQPLTFEVSLALSDNATAVYKSILKIIWMVVESLKRLKFDIDMNKVVYSSTYNLFKHLNKQVNHAAAYQIYMNNIKEGYSISSSIATPTNSSNNYYIDTLLKFRTLLDSLLFMDPITFVEQLEKMKNDSSNWVCTPNGIKLFKKSNERLFKIDKDNVEMNIEKNLKYEYINKIFQSDLTNEQLANMIKNNFKFEYVRRNPLLFRRLKTNGVKFKCNLSIDEKRRYLVGVESKHLSYFNEYFKKGKKLRRNILIIVENYYLVDYLNQYFRYDFHLNKLLQLMQMNIIRSGGSDTTPVANNNKYDFNSRSKKSFSNEYYSNVNKDILNKTNIFNLYKHLIDTNSPGFDVISSFSSHGTNTQNTSSNDGNNINSDNSVIDVDASDSNLNSLSISGIDPELGIEIDLINIDTDKDDNKPIDVDMESGEGSPDSDAKELLDYLDINVDFDEYVFNSINIIKSFSNVYTGKIDKFDRLMGTLMTQNPCIIVIYSPSVHVFRIIENYCALKFSRGPLYRKRLNFLQVHVLSYKECLETHRFTKGLKSELDCWSYLQNQKKSLIVRLDESILLNKKNFVGQVIVDLRELVCKLPYYLFNMGIQVIPTALEIGDYVVTRDLCIERKSLLDLFTSINSTRLSKQLSEMCSAYANPFLLIEFDESEKFHLSSVGDSRYGHNYIYTKLIIICCNFPKLRLIWSSSPQETANIIKHLKVNRSDPDIITNEYLIKNFRNKSEKVSLPTPDTTPLNSETGKEMETIGLRRPEFVKNRDALKILRNIPGVTTHNISQILTKAKSLLHLSEFSLIDLCQFLPEHEARQIHDFFNMPISNG